MRPGDWTSLSQWLSGFRALHEQARIGKLDRKLRDAYEQDREVLAKALLIAQRLAVRPGQTARQTLRVAVALPVDLTVRSVRQTISTLDLGLGGFAAMLEKPPSVNEKVEFALTLRRMEKAVGGRAKVIHSQRKGKPFRVAFAFEGLPESDADSIALEVFGTALDSIPLP